MEPEAPQLVSKRDAGMLWILLFVLLMLVTVAAPFAPQAFATGADMVLIEKSKRLLTVMQGSKQLAQFHVALGGSPVGPKHCQGDNKTPEGTYRVVNRNPKSAFHRALRLSYPSEQDRALAKHLGCAPGGDIMIHGLPNGRGWLGAAHRQVDWTLGCIAVTDAEIEEIWKLVPDDTLVRILP